jgi:hypothetical protein
MMAVVFFLLSASGWMRLYDSLSRWYWLNDSGVQPGPPYLAATGAVWGIAGIAAFLWLTRELPWNRLVGMGVVLICLLTYWADRLLFTRAPYADSNTAFALLFSVFGLASALLFLRPADEFRRLARLWQANHPTGEPPGSLP